LVVSLVVLVAVIVGLIYAVRGMMAYIRGLNSDVAKTVVPAAIAAVVSVVAVVFGKAYEMRAGIRKELRDRKAPVYEELVKKLFSIFFAEKRGETKPTEQEFLLFFTWATEKMTIWGADDVLVKFARFRTAGEDATNIMFLFEDLLMAIRKDLGHKNSGFKRGAILRLFINDIDDFLGRPPNKPLQLTIPPQGKSE
jgi:hypothetical protein